MAVGVEEVLNMETVLIFTGVCVKDFCNIPLTFSLWQTDQWAEEKAVE